jgi:hypothetical protein
MQVMVKKNLWKKINDDRRRRRHHGGVHGHHRDGAMQHNLTILLRLM